MLLWFVLIILTLLFLTECKLHIRARRRKEGDRVTLSNTSVMRLTRSAMLGQSRITAPHTSQIYIHKKTGLTVSKQFNRKFKHFFWVLEAIKAGRTDVLQPRKRLRQVFKCCVD